MKIHLISQNVQGLNAPEAPQRLRNYYSSYFRHIDVLTLARRYGDKLISLGARHQLVIAILRRKLGQGTGGYVYSLTRVSST
jgi:hypothetical protein